MRKSIISTCFIIGILTISLVQAEDYGMVMDLSGHAKVIRGGAKTTLDLGQTIFEGDRIKVKAKSQLTLISYADCQEWKMEGPIEVTVSWQLKSTGSGHLTRVRELPVCYSHEDISINKDSSIGGLVLRGSPVDPVKKLRDDFSNGHASNSTLITLILHDISKGESAKAKPYLLELEARAPGSSFVKKMKPLFKDKE